MRHKVKRKGGSSLKGGSLYSKEERERHEGTKASNNDDMFLFGYERDFFKYFED